MEEMMITLNEEGIKSLKNLVLFCPGTFSSVPVKFFKDEDGISYVSIEAIDINGDVVFSGRSKINDIELEENTGMIILLPLNKTLTNIILNSDFTTLEVSKSKIVASSPNKRITLSLFSVSEDDIMEFPYTGLELYQLAKDDNGIEDSNYVLFEPDLDEFKELINTISSFVNITSITFKSRNGKLFVKSKDMLGNKIEYTFDNVPVDGQLNCTYSIELIKHLNKVMKLKDNEKVEMLISDLIIALTVKDEEENSIITIAITAIRE